MTQKSLLNVLPTASHNAGWNVRMPAAKKKVPYFAKKPVQQTRVKWTASDWLRTCRMTSLVQDTGDTKSLFSVSRLEGRLGAGRLTGAWKAQRGLETVQSLCALSPAHCSNDGERKGPKTHRSCLIQTNSSKHPFFHRPRLPFHSLTPLTSTYLPSSALAFSVSAHFCPEFLCIMLIKRRGLKKHTVGGKKRVWVLAIRPNKMSSFSSALATARDWPIFVCWRPYGSTSFRLISIWSIMTPLSYSPIGYEVATSLILRDAWSAAGGSSANDATWVPFPWRKDCIDCRRSKSHRCKVT